MSTALPASTASTSEIAGEPPTAGIRVVGEPKAEPGPVKRLPGTESVAAADDAKTSAEEEQTAQDDEELDYVVIDAELGDALRNASVTEVRHTRRRVTRPCKMQQKMQKWRG